MRILRPLVVIVCFAWTGIAVLTNVRAFALSTDGLPLIEFPVSATQDERLAVLLSGDGGWADFDQTISMDFQTRGIATIGVDCQRYFWKPRTPNEVAAAMDETLRHYLNVWHKNHLLLIGFSFGANWLPFLVNRLPDDLKNLVTQMVLLSPGKYANVEIQADDWTKIKVRHPGALATKDEINRVGLPTLCVWGVQDTEPTGCTALSGQNIRKLAKPGGHYYDENFVSLEKAILN